MTFFMEDRKGEFCELWRRSGWKPSQLAKKLHLTRGGLHGILNGPTVPSAGTLELLRKTLMIEQPWLFRLEGGECHEAALSPHAAGLAERLEGLRQANPDAHHAFEVLLSQLAPSSDKARAVAEQLLADASSQLSQQSAPGAEAEPPTVPRRKRERRARKH
jgi:transcriptional regulator with XRE-family HTH domain